MSFWRVKIHILNLFPSIVWATLKTLVSFILKLWCSDHTKAPLCSFIQSNRQEKDRITVRSVILANTQLCCVTETIGQLYCGWRRGRTDWNLILKVKMKGQNPAQCVCAAVWRSVFISECVHVMLSLSDSQLLCYASCLVATKGSIVASAMTNNLKGHFWISFFSVVMRISPA